MFCALDERVDVMDVADDDDDAASAASEEDDDEEAAADADEVLE